MRRFAATALALALAAPLSAQTKHTDFSGKWTLDMTQTPAGPMTPSAATATVTQTDTSLKLEQSATTQMGTQSQTFKYALNSTTSKNTIDTPNGPLELQSTIAWDGAVLVITTQTEVQGNVFKTVDHWALDAAGKVLTITSDISFGPQAMSRKQVFNKS